MGWGEIPGFILPPFQVWVSHKLRKKEKKKEYVTNFTSSLSPGARTGAGPGDLWWHASGPMWSQGGELLMQFDLLPPSRVASHPGEPSAVNWGAAHSPPRWCVLPPGLLSVPTGTLGPLPPPEVPLTYGLELGLPPFGVAR